MQMLGVIISVMLYVHKGMYESSLKCDFIVTKI